jgi:hypothetical protein
VSCTLLAPSKPEGGASTKSCPAPAIVNGTAAPCGAPGTVRLTTFLGEAHGCPAVGLGWREHLGSGDPLHCAPRRSPSDGNPQGVALQLDA